MATKKASGKGKKAAGTKKPAGKKDVKAEVKEAQAPKAAKKAKAPAVKEEAKAPAVKAEAKVPAEAVKSEAPAVKEKAKVPAEVAKAFAIYRLINPTLVIKFAAGRETTMKDFQGLLMLAGMNAIITGGYLTTRGRTVPEDDKLLEDLRLFS